MDKVRRVSDGLLEGSVEVRKGLCAAAETEVGAEVVATLEAMLAATAHDAGFDGDPLSGNEMLHAGADCSDDSGGLMAEDERGSDVEITVLAMEVIVDYNKRSETRWMKRRWD
jgi:hypothetical protein